ncbi:MAG: hypothetical protein AB8B99_08560 [Phormidesmis sp.]
MLLNEYPKGSLGCQLYTDSLANVLAVNLLREHATTQARLPTYEGGLPPRQLRHILDYIDDAHLDEDIKLADLARLLDMSLRLLNLKTSQPQDFSTSRLLNLNTYNALPDIGVLILAY